MKRRSACDATELPASCYGSENYVTVSLVFTDFVCWTIRSSCCVPSCFKSSNSKIYSLVGPRIDNSFRQGLIPTSTIAFQNCCLTSSVVHCCYGFIINNVCSTCSKIPIWPCITLHLHTQATIVPVEGPLHHRRSPSPGRSRKPLLSGIAVVCVDTT